MSQIKEALDLTLIFSRKFKITLKNSMGRVSRLPVQILLFPKSMTHAAGLQRDSISQVPSSQIQLGSHSLQNGGQEQQRSRHFGPQLHNTESTGGNQPSRCGPHLQQLLLCHFCSDHCSLSWQLRPTVAEGFLLLQLLHLLLWVTWFSQNLSHYI